MGDDIKRDLDSNDDAETLENAEELIDKANSFVDKLGKVASDANMVLDKKEKIDNAESSKKKSETSSDSKTTENDAMEKDEKIDQFIDGMEKLKDHKGDVELSEAIDFVKSNKTLIKQRL